MNPPASIEIIGLSTTYTKKDIKRELKANGLGHVDEIHFVPTRIHNLQRAYVWFRPTKKAFVVAKREKLAQKISEDMHGLANIRVCCVETPRIFHPIVPEEDRVNEDIYWCVTKGSSLPLQQERRIVELERKIKSITDVMLQLLDGLFNQGTQKTILEYYINILLDRPESPVDSGEFTWPTTRQGDELEWKVESLKTKISQLEDGTFPSKPDGGQPGR